MNEQAKILIDTYLSEPVAKVSHAQVIEESFEIVKSFVYKGLQLNGELTEGYVNQMKEILKKRVALGGMRIKQALEEMYPKSKI